MPLKSPGPQTSVLLFNWQANWTSLLAIALEVAALGWYIVAVRRMGVAGKTWPRFRTASFALGLVVVAYAVEGGIANYERVNFSAHVVQLLLLVDVAPPLLAIGAPTRLALQSSSRRASTLVVRALHSRPARFVTRPLVAWAIPTASMYVYFLTPVYPWSERHPTFLAYVDVHFLLAGGVLWWVVVGRDAMPKAAGFGMRFALVFLSVPVNAYLGLAIASVTKPLYPAANTLADTRAGGNVLWALAEVFLVAAVALLFVEWAREEERKAVRADRQLDAAMAAARVAVAPPEPNGGSS